nr:DapH/DapD/GlmU-related protein [uncultured Leptotrichia sp.]
MEKSFYEIWKLGMNVIKTKIFFPKARLIRFPFDIRGKKYIKYGKNFTTGTGCRIEAYKFDGKVPNLEIGDNVQINDYVHFSCAESLIIGDNVLIASKVYITDLNHGNYSGKEQSNPQEIVKERKIYTKPVKIENNVWIGENVSILPGVEIGENAILGANSVVTKNVPKNSIVAGNPAKVIKVYNKNTGEWEKV